MIGRGGRHAADGIQAHPKGLHETLNRSSWGNGLVFSSSKLPTTITSNPSRQNLVGSGLDHQANHHDASNRGQGQMDCLSTSRPQYSRAPIHAPIPGSNSRKWTQPWKLPFRRPAFCLGTSNMSHPCQWVPFAVKCLSLELRGSFPLVPPAPLSDRLHRCPLPRNSKRALFPCRQLPRLWRCLGLLVLLLMQLPSYDLDHASLLLPPHNYIGLNDQQSCFHGRVLRLWSSHSSPLPPSLRTLGVVVPVSRVGQLTPNSRPSTLVLAASSTRHSPTQLLVLHF